MTGGPPAPEDRNPPRAQVAVLHKALDLLECLAAAPLTAAEISSRIGVAKATVYRLLNTLQSRGFVTKEPDGPNYMIGSAVQALGAAVSNSADLVSLTRPFLTKLASRYGETVNLAIKSNSEILYLDVLQSGHRLRTDIPAGSRDHLHSTALGKAILAGLPEAEARAILSTIDRTAPTPNTVVAIPALLRQLNAIRLSGYAIDDEENEIGSVCVASTIRGHDGRPIGAISISGPRWRIDDALAKAIGAELVATCNSLSEVFDLSRRAGLSSPA